MSRGLPAYTRAQVPPSRIRLRPPRRRPPPASQRERRAAAACGHRRIDWIATTKAIATTKTLLQSGGAAWRRGETRVRHSQTRKPARLGALHLPATLPLPCEQTVPAAMTTWQSCGSQRACRGRAAISTRPKAQHAPLRRRRHQRAHAVQGVKSRGGTAAAGRRQRGRSARRLNRWSLWQTE